MTRRQQQADRALRPAMRSPGRPMPARHVERAFWRLIAEGKRTEEAALQIGVSTPVAVRWFRHAGGMPPLSLAEPTGRYLSFSEREEIALLKAQGTRRPCDRPAAQARSPDDLARGAAQRRDLRRQARLPGECRTVEGADRGAASQAGEAGEQPAAAEVRAEPVERAVAAS
jgi:hypothetical protein